MLILRRVILFDIFFIRLESHNYDLKMLLVTEELKNLAVSLEKRIVSLEGGPAQPAAGDDEDVDLFGSSDDEEDEEKAKV